MCRRPWLAAFALLTSLLVGQAAWAHVLPADFIMRMLADKRRRMGIADLSIQLTTEITGQDAATEERIYLKNPERMRRVRQGEDETTVTVQREGKSARGPENALEKLKGPAPDLLPGLLMPRGKDLDEMQRRMVVVLKAIGIDVSVTALGRHEDRVCYIVGARAYEKDAPQLWIDKETFLPLRLIRISKDKSRREVRWLDFGSSATGDWFPRVIEVYVDGERVERSEVAKIELNKKVPETLFDLP